MMEQRMGLRGTFVLLAIVLSAVAVERGPGDRETEALRERFLEDFTRILIDTTPGDGMLLRVLIEASGAKRGIEVGTARGHGAIHMGIAFERTGGHLDSVEIDADMVRKARENLKTVALADTVTVIHGDALEVLPKLEGKYDFVFIDALKRDYMKYLKAVESKLLPGAVIVADNTIRYADAMRDFLDYLAESPDYDVVTVRASMEKRDGMTIAYKIR